MNFCFFTTSRLDEINILNETGGEPAGARIFQTGLRILLPPEVRSQCGIAPPTVNDPHELIQLRAILARLLAEGRVANDQEIQISRQAIADAASQFASEEYRKAVLHWLTMQGYAEIQGTLPSSISEEQETKTFFP